MRSWEREVIQGWKTKQGVVGRMGTVEEGVDGNDLGVLRSRDNGAKEE